MVNETLVKLALRLRDEGWRLKDVIQALDLKKDETLEAILKKW